MRVSTKILAGYAILLLLMTGAIGYDLVLVQQMHGISEELSRVYFPRALSGLRVREHLGDVEEYTLKYLLVGTDEDEQAYIESVARFDRVLGELEQVGSPATTPGARGTLARLERTWIEYRAAVEASLGDQDAGTITQLPVTVSDHLSRLYAHVDRLRDETSDAVVDDLERAEQINESARRVSWMTAGTALLIAGGVAFLIVRSITGGLDRLTEGTRWLQEGHLSRRIPEDRNDEFGELARRFNTMAHRLEEVDQLKKDFVSAVSHELKSPIAASREIVQLLLDEVPGALNDEQRRLLELSTRSSRRLSSMVGTLLDMARMDAGTIRYDMGLSEIDTLVTSTIEEFEALARERDLKIVTAYEPGKRLVRCDADRITQVIGNVIDNAIKFAPRGSTIRVGIDDVADPESVVVWIADSGPGIADVHKERVFARFQQVRPEGSRHPRGGTGLGLAICRDIITAHDGRIWVETNENGGSTFRVMLPA
jgi:signal transduction histidine kinase